MITPQVVTVGESLISLRSEGLIRLGAGFSTSVGGAESNVAIALARLGHAVEWVGVLGADEPGALIARTLRAEGVVARSRRVADRPTGLTMIEARLASTARVTYYRAGSAGAALTPADVLPALRPGVQILHVTGITPALSPSARDAIFAAVDRAHTIGARVSLDLNYRAKLWDADEAGQVLRRLAAQADLLIASADELVLLGVGETDESIRQLVSQGAEAVAITRGSAGATIVTAERTSHLPAHSVPVADTVGAGDAFAAGFLSGLIDGQEPHSAAERGVAVAAFSVATAGDWEGLPDRAELGLLDLEPGGAVR